MNKEILEKLSNIDTRISDMGETLIRQEGHLREHMRRSDALEVMILNLESEFKPVQKHIIMVEGIIKFLGLLSLVIGVAGGILRLFGIF